MMMVVRIEKCTVGGENKVVVRAELSCMAGTASSALLGELLRPAEDRQCLDMGLGKLPGYVVMDTVSHF